MSKRDRLRLRYRTECAPATIARLTVQRHSGMGPMESEVSLADGLFQVRLWSEGSGEPLLYLHGFEGHPGDAPFLQRLAKQRRVLVPHHPGFSGTGGLDGIDGILDLTLLYRDLLDAVGAGRTDVIGHSLGGMFAAELAAVCRPYVRKLILVDAFGLWLDDAPIPDPFVMSPRHLGTVLWHDPEGDVAKAAAPPRGGAAAIERTQNLGAATKFLWPIPDRGLRKRLRHIRAPTLVIWGASDRLIGSEYADAFHAAIPGSRLVTVENAGHLPMLEQPDAFAAAVDAFLDS